MNPGKPTSLGDRALASAAPKSVLRSLARGWLPAFLRQRLRRIIYRKLGPPVGGIRFGDFRRLTPIGPDFGWERGRCIDRYYIERFLQQHAGDIQGAVLEIGDNAYTLKFGGEKVCQSDVLNATAGNSQATIIADLAKGDTIQSERFDCVILTQTLMFVYDVRAAIHTLRRILKPGGVVLCTVACISQIPRYDMDHWGDFWRFTSLSTRRLFEEAFPTANVQVQPYGNVLTAMAFLHGIAQEELTVDELDYRDPDYEMLVTVRAVKPKAL